MTTHNPGPAGPAPATASRTRPGAPPVPHLDCAKLHGGVAGRRVELLHLEMAMVAKCEARAAHGATPGVDIADRETWDRATWTRYLAAAAALEPEFGPAMRQLYREIDQLQRLAALPLAQRVAA